MKTRPLSLLAVAAVAALAFWICYSAACWIRTGMLSPADDLAWLKSEFGLSGEELSRIRVLHEGYLPECRQRCAMIEAKDREIAALMSTNGAVTPGLEKSLREAAALRAECQAQMLKHFYEVSRAMPPDQGRRYLEEMQRLTLNLHSGHAHGLPGPDAATHAHH
jgi:hypothetical protein